MYESDKLFIDQNKGPARVVPIYQMNTRVINRYIAKKYPSYNFKDLPSNIQLWYNNLHQDGMSGKSKDNYLSVFPYLDDVIEYNIH